MTSLYPGSGLKQLITIDSLFSAMHSNKNAISRQIAMEITQWYIDRLQLLMAKFQCGFTWQVIIFSLYFEPLKICLLEITLKYLTKLFIFCLIILWNLFSFKVKVRQNLCHKFGLIAARNLTLNKLVSKFQQFRN